MKTPEVRVGQLWADNDKRNVFVRYLLVSSIVDGQAVCESWYEHKRGFSRTARVALNRMRPTSTGYRLVAQPDDDLNAKAAELELAAEFQPADTDRGAQLRADAAMLRARAAELHGGSR